MLTEIEARKLVQDYLLNTERKLNAFGRALPDYSEKNHCRLVILESYTEEHYFGWLFYWNSQQFAESGDPMHMLVGSGPLIIDREDGSLHETGSGRPTSWHVEEFRRHRMQRLAGATTNSGNLSHHPA